MSNRKKITSRSANPLDHGRMDATIRRMHDIQSTFAGRYNAYICQTCDKAYLTLDIDHGTTPGTMQCFATEGCEGTAVSMGYPEGDPPEAFGPPIIHWVKPNKAQLDRIRTVKPSLYDYASRGGLICQATTATPEWVRERL